MIQPFVNIARAKRSWRLLKIYANVWGALVLVAVAAPFLGPGVFPLLEPATIKDITAGCALLGSLLYFITSTQVANLAQDLGRSYWRWLLGALMAPPISFFVAYYRVRALAM